MTDQPKMLRSIPTSENAIAADFGLRMSESFYEKNGRHVPKDDREFAWMLAIAFILGRESIVGDLEDA